MAMSLPSEESSQTVELTILLLGKTGHGKSATGNSILLDKKAFKTSNAATSRATDVQSSFGEYTTRGGKLCRMKVIDGPGLQDTNISKAQDRRRAYQNIARVLVECDSGVSAFIVVIRMGARFTEEEQEAVEYLKRVLGQQFLSSHGVIVVTHGEDFNDEDDDDEEPTTFPDWYHQQKGSLQELFEECKYRCVLFSNKAKDKDTQINQLETLLEKVEEILKSNKGSSYTAEVIQEFSDQHKTLMKEFGFEVIKEEFRRHLSEIQKKVKHIVDELSVKKALSANDALLTRVHFEAESTGNPKNLERDLDNLKNVLVEMKEMQPGTEAFKGRRKNAEEMIDRIVDRASFPDDPNFCQRMTLRFYKEYPNRYF